MVQSEKFPSALINSVKTPAFTDLTRWRLKVEHGAQTWHYLNSDDEVKEWPQTRWDKYFLGIPFVSDDHLERHYSMLLLLSLLMCQYECRNRTRKSYHAPKHHLKPRVTDLSSIRSSKLKMVTGLVNMVALCT
jgi:hypothetical protein